MRPFVLGAEDSFCTQARPRRSGLALSRPAALEPFRRPDPSEDVWILPRVAGSVAEPADGIRLPAGCTRLDAGVTLALTVGAGARIERIAVALDVVRRDVPADQAYLARSYPTHTPIGAFVPVTDDDLSSFRMVLEVDGRTRQDAFISDLIASPRQLVASIARRVPLDAGTIILVGTPPGVAFDREEGWLTVDTSLRATIEGVGELDTRVVPDEPALHAQPDDGTRVLVTGTNYRSHAREMEVGARPVPTANLVKLPGTVRESGASIVIPPETLVDYEGEVAAVIGSDAYQVTPDQAHEVLAGLCLANDVTARDAPTTHLVLAKGAPGFCPLGEMVPLADLDSYGVTFTVSVNGDVRQRGDTREMVHSIREVVSSYSASLPLRAGDVILTGSPAGVGVGLDPPKFLQPGDTVTIESDQLGCLSNRFVATDTMSDHIGGQNRL